MRPKKMSGCVLPRRDLMLAQALARRASGAARDPIRLGERKAQHGASRVGERWKGGRLDLLVVETVVDAQGGVPIGTAQADRESEIRIFACPTGAPPGSAASDV